MKRCAAILLLICLMLSLCGCGSIFEKEYVSVTDSVAPPEGESDNTERYSVRNMTELKKALIGMVYDGAPGGSIAFDASYSGDAAMEKIVNYYESAVTIDYTSYAAELSSIIQLPYAVGLEDILSTAMEENRQRITILIGTSSYSVENMKSLALDLYRENPTLCVREPQLTVFMYSGAGRQRLYEINFHYGMAEDEVIRCKSQLKNLDVVSNLGAEGLDEVHGALAACRYLTENCVYSQSAAGSCYDALILRESNSEGLALAYVEMCHQLGIECLAVYGQMSGSDHCWNIVKIDGDYYHVDVSRCYDGDYADGFLLDDESMWNDYRWNISNYPACNGSITFSEINSAEEDTYLTNLSDAEKW